MKYLIARNGQQIGSYTAEELEAALRDGRVQPTDFAWREGMANWVGVTEIAGAAGAPGAAPAMAPNSGFGAPPASSVGAGSGFGGMGGSVPPKPGNFLVPSILATIFCCLPFGIAGIVFAAQVDGKYSSGDYAGAEKSAKNARLWTWISFGVGLAGIAAYAAMMAMGFAAGMADAGY